MPTCLIHTINRSDIVKADKGDCLVVKYTFQYWISDLYPEDEDDNQGIVTHCVGVRTTRHDLNLHSQRGSVAERAKKG